MPMQQAPRTTSRYSRYYSPDSSARQLQEQAVSLPRPAPRPSPRPAPRRGGSTKRRPVFVEDVQARHRHNFLSYVLVLAFFGCAIVVLMTNARLTYNHANLETYRAQLVDLQATNAAMESAMIASLDFAEIERIAIYELGMAPAEEFQYFAINVQPRSFLSHSDVQEAPQNNSWTFDRFRNVILNITGGN